MTLHRFVNIKIKRKSYDNSIRNLNYHFNQIMVIINFPRRFTQIEIPQIFADFFKISVNQRKKSAQISGKISHFINYIEI